MTKQSRIEKAIHFISRLLQTGVGVYLVLFVVFYAVYFVNGYEQLATHKFELLKSMSGCFALVMIPLAIIYTLLKIHGHMNFAEWFLQEISLTDAAMCDFACVLVISYALTTYKEEALWGTAGWYMGLGTQLIMVGIYFFTSRFFDGKKIMHFLYLFGVVSFALMLWGLLNRFSLYPIEMEYSQPAFISSMGNINWFCGYYSVVFGIGAVLYFISESKCIRAFAMVHSLVAFGLGVVEGSDSAFLSLFTCFFILFLFSFSQTQKMKRFLELLCGYAMSCQILRLWDVCFPGCLNMNSFMIQFMLGNSTFVLLFIAAGIRFLIEVKDKKDGIFGKDWIRDYQNVRTGVVIFLIVAMAIYVGLLIQNTKYPGSIGTLSKYGLFYFGASWGSNRAITWQDGLMIFKSMTPVQKIFGAGPDCFAIYAYNHPDISVVLESQFGGSRLTNAHNEMITMLVNLGIWGLFTFLTTFVSSAVRLVRCLPKKPAALIFVVSICSYLLHNQFSFQQILNTPYIYMMLGLAECMMRDMRKTKAENNEKVSETLTKPAHPPKI